MGSFTPSTVPGCRAPHFWLEDGRSVYDAFGPGYTMLSFGESAAVTALTAAFADAGVPLAVIKVPASLRRPEYRHDFVICREDQHVAWRGDRSPADAGGLVEALRGAGG